MPKNELCPIDKVVEHPELQMRTDGFEESYCGEMVESLKDSETVELPRVYVVDVGGVYFLVDGHYRRRAYLRAGRTHIPIVVEKGDWKLAVLRATAANVTQTAKRRTNADKRRAVQQCLDVLETSGEVWSNEKVKRHCCVSLSLVRTIRDEERRQVPDPGLKPTPTQTYDRKERKLVVLPQPIAEGEADEEEAPLPIEPPDPPVVRGTDGRATRPTMHRDGQTKPQTPIDFEGMRRQVGVLWKQITEAHKIEPTKSLAFHSAIGRNLEEVSSLLDKWQRVK